MQRCRWKYKMHHHWPSGARFVCTPQHDSRCPYHWSVLILTRAVMGGSFSSDRAFFSITFELFIALIWHVLLHLNLRFIQVRSGQWVMQGLRHVFEIRGIRGDKARVRYTLPKNEKFADLAHYFLKLVQNMFKIKQCKIKWNFFKLLGRIFPPSFRIEGDVSPLPPQWRSPCQIGRFVTLVCNICCALEKKTH